MRLLLRIGFDKFTMNKDDIISIYKTGYFDGKE